MWVQVANGADAAAFVTAGVRLTHYCRSEMNPLRVCESRLGAV